MPNTKIRHSGNSIANSTAPAARYIENVASLCRTSKRDTAVNTQGRTNTDYHSIRTAASAIHASNVIGNAAAPLKGWC
jgi:hypothetical protein